MLSGSSSGGIEKIMRRDRGEPESTLGLSMARKVRQRNLRSAIEAVNPGIYSAGNEAAASASPGYHLSKIRLNEWRDRVPRKGREYERDVQYFDRMKLFEPSPYADFIVVLVIIIVSAAIKQSVQFGKAVENLNRAHGKYPTLQDGEIIDLETVRAHKATEVQKQRKVLQDGNELRSTEGVVGAEDQESSLRRGTFLKDCTRMRQTIVIEAVLSKGQPSQRKGESPEHHHARTRASSIPPRERSSLGLREPGCETKLHAGNRDLFMQPVGVLRLVETPQLGGRRATSFHRRQMCISCNVATDLTEQSIARSHTLDKNAGHDSRWKEHLAALKPSPAASRAQTHGVKEAEYASNGAISVSILARTLSCG
ncbi:hypothetical protein K438DRAFT_1935139 [Mycena galopus ATCC 62051]|nr:hypothetical protein K438DRAFT_1935139 [Mycena galopus ATCC 62051]